jgi:hypothetical protein
VPRMTEILFGLLIAVIVIAVVNAFVRGGE